MDLQTWIWYKKYLDIAGPRRIVNETKGARWLSVLFLLFVLIAMGSCVYMAWSNL